MAHLVGKGGYIIESACEIEEDKVAETWAQHGMKGAALFACTWIDIYLTLFDKCVEYGSEFGIELVAYRGEYFHCLFPCIIWVGPYGDRDIAFVVC